MKVECKDCLMRQPTEAAASCFDSSNPAHFECAMNGEYFPDMAYMCPDFVSEN